MRKHKFSIDNRTLHHSHITGEYIATICKTCNNNQRLKRFVPIIAHNSKNYDIHFIVEKMNSTFLDVECIAENQD